MYVKPITKNPQEQFFNCDLNMSSPTYNIAPKLNEIVIPQPRENSLGKKFGVIFAQHKQLIPKSPRVIAVIFLNKAELNAIFTKLCWLCPGVGMKPLA